jgi:hypothetical protein
MDPVRWSLPIGPVDGPSKTLGECLIDLEHGDIELPDGTLARMNGDYGVGVVEERSFAVPNC